MSEALYEILPWEMCGEIESFLNWEPVMTSVMDHITGIEFTEYFEAIKLRRKHDYFEVYYYRLGLRHRDDDRDD